MAKKKVELEPVEVVEAEETVEVVEELKGCSACNNTGLDRVTGMTEAQLCPVCNGSPFVK